VWVSLKMMIFRNIATDAQIIFKEINGHRCTDSI